MESAGRLLSGSSALLTGTHASALYLPARSMEFAESPCPPGGACMEVLTEVLKAVKLNGALFYNAEFSAPWCAHSVDAETVNSHLSPQAQHVIIFHLLTQGRCYANLEGDDRQVLLNAGDIIIVP